jgi:hypothetical protein
MMRGMIGSVLVDRLGEEQRAVKPSFGSRQLAMQVSGRGRKPIIQRDRLAADAAGFLGEAAARPAEAPAQLRVLRHPIDGTGQGGLGCSPRRFFAVSSRDRGFIVPLPSDARFGGST